MPAGPKPAVSKRHFLSIKAEHRLSSVVEPRFIPLFPNLEFRLMLSSRYNMVSFFRFALYSQFLASFD